MAQMKNDRELLTTIHLKLFESIKRIDLKCY